MRPADKGPRSTIRFRSHTASVYDDDIGRERLTFSNRAQMSGYGLAIRASRSASEVLDEKPRHCSSLEGFVTCGDSPGSGAGI
jgi:hypothetical protein